MPKMLAAEKARLRRNQEARGHSLTPGRPRTVVPEDASDTVYALAADGNSLDGIAFHLGTTRKTLGMWFDEDAALKEAFDQGREQERYQLHNLLYRKATEDGNIVAAMFLLKSRHGYREGDQSEQGNRVSVSFTLPGALKPEQFVIENGDG